MKGRTNFWGQRPDGEGGKEGLVTQLTFPVTELVGNLPNRTDSRP